MKTIEEARAEAAQYAAAGFVLDRHLNLVTETSRLAPAIEYPRFDAQSGKWYALGRSRASLDEAMKVCEDHNDGSLGRRIAEASRRARGAADPDRRPDVGFGAKHIAARAVVDSLPAGRPPVDPMEHAALLEAYERVRAVAVAAAGMMSSRVNPRERGRMTAALEDAIGRLHDGDLRPWDSPAAIEAAQDAQALAEAHGPHCPAWCPERGKVDRTVSLDEVKATLDADPPEDLLDATRSAR